ncbi:putative glycosyl transferase [Roseovarius gaetbuli]|uniref:Putative glycosyl transferase n=1 Tax=Roseovarius gaetbuli TaxID=1356575 RepID=A0A1X7A4F2_9RHOB|nr:putative glycosyl transferase [Roseovarius gaetbuli]
MLRRLHGLFKRYCAQNLEIRQTGCTLKIQGKTWGAVTGVSRLGNRLEVTGWAYAPAVELHCGQESVRAATSVPKQHSGDHCGGPEARVFNLDMPVGAVPEVQLSLEGSQSHVFDLPVIAPSAVTLAKARLLPKFAWRLVTAVPLVGRWAYSRDPALRPRIRAALGFWTLPVARPLQSALFAGPASSPEVQTTFTCILPVYNAFDILPEVLRRIAHHTDMPFHLVIIEDASTDPDVRPYLRDWVSEHDNVQLIENAENLGFIHSVNRGFEVALERGGPVVLLNSDAFVPIGWAGRLLAPILSNDAVASTTPFSNDAEIFSVPANCARTLLRPGEGDALDIVAKSFAGGAADAPAPTGVGFCMGMSGAWLAQVPRFDPVFGLGYGEEVDWCQKTRALGARHVGVANLFVEHRGGASFGSAQKQRLVAQAAEQITRRYPSYDIEVQDYLRADPMLTPRLALALAWLAQRAGDVAVPVYLSHAMGGGVAQYLQMRLAQDIEVQGGAVVLRVGTDMRWRLEVHSAAGLVMGGTDDFALVQRLLDPVRHRHVVYVCGVGDTHPTELPMRLLDLTEAAAGRKATLEIQMHDYYPLSPSFTLLDADHAWRGGVPDDSTDPAHTAFGPLSRWRAGWAHVMEHATRVVTFSRDSRTHVLAVWPQIGRHLEVIPHALTNMPDPVVPRAGARPVIGVLGNLNIQKGALVVAALGRALQTGTRDLDLVLLGAPDPACPPLPGVTVHGPYARKDIALLAHRYQISGWLIASIWPETFSYTTHEALATGLPVFCFDLGAQAEAVKAAGAQGHVVPCHSDPQTQARVLLAGLRKTLTAQTS